MYVLFITINYDRSTMRIGYKCHLYVYVIIVGIMVFLGRREFMIHMVQDVANKQ